MRAAYDLKKNGLSNLLIEDIFHTFETWPSEDALIRLIKEEVKKYRAFTQTKNENNNKQENLQADNNEINKNLRLEMIILYCKDANTIHDPTTRLLCHAVANVYLLNEKHEKSAIFSTDTLMITQQKDAFHDYLRRKISDVKREMEKMEKKSASFFQRQMELVGYMYLEDKIEEAPFKDTLQEIFPHSVFTQSICIEDVNNNHPFYLQEVLVEKLAELQSKLNEVEIDKCKELHYKKWILTAEQVDFLYQTIDEISRDLSCSFYHTNRNGLSKEEIFNRALQTLGIKAHDISISADNCYHFSIRQKCIDKIKQLLAAANAAVILQKGIFGTPMIKHIKIIENKKGEPALQLNLVSHIDPYYFHQWKMNQIRKEFDVNKKDQSGEMHELENCWNIIPLNVLHRIVAHHALAEDEKKRLHTKANSIPFVSIEKDPIAHPLVQDILFHLQNMPIDKDLLYKIIEDYFINNTNDYGNKYTNGCQNGKKIWKRLLNHCEACLKKPDLQPNDQLVYRAICNYRALLPLWPEIQTMDELFIAQEKLEFISFFQKNAPFQAEANVFTAYHQTHAHGFSLVTNKHLSEHATAAKNDICEQIRGSDIYTTLNDIIEKDSLFLAAAFYSKEKKK